MTLDALAVLARPAHLAILGALYAEPSDGLGTGTIALLGPAEPGFWPHVTSSREFQDGVPDPLDRWSTRVITKLAKDLGAMPLFPFGQPSRPFISWALRSGRAFMSPASLLVHTDAGLFVSYRGAILFPKALPLPEPQANPCDTCQGKPCLAACPPRALTEKGYDLPACHGYLDTSPGKACMSRGCAVRRSCPLAANYPRMDEQSAFHMKAFHKWP